MPTHPIVTTMQHGVSQQYEQLMASLDAIFWEADAQTLQYTYVSEQAERLLGYSSHAWTQPNFWVEHIHPDDQAWAIAFCRQATSENRNHSFEYRMIAADGRIIWLRDIVSVVVEPRAPHKLCGVMVDITERKLAEEERQSHLWFLENMDKINRAIQRAHDLEQMMRDVFDVVLAIFRCDRVSFLYPCDPMANLWHVSMERTQPEYPGDDAAALESSMDPDIARVFQVALTANQPVTFGQGAEHVLPLIALPRYGIQSILAMAIYPKVDKPYLFELQQCSHARLWRTEEQRLFQEIGHRLADALNTLLTYRRLQESELRYREIFENTSDMIAITEVTADDRFKMVDANAAVESLLKVNREQLVGMFLEDLGQVNQSAQQVAADFHLCLEKKVPMEFDREWHTASGHWLLHYTLLPVRNAAGHIYRMIGMGRNLTAQKRAEERLRVFLDQATDAFFLHDSSGLILDVNHRACEMLGYTREELIGMNPLMFAPNLNPPAATDLAHRLKAGESIIVESQHRRKDGSIYPVELRMRAVWEGGQQFHVSLVQDITERKQAQASLTLFRSLIDQSNDFIEIIDPETGCFLDVNESACLAHGYTRSEFLALTLSEIDPMIATIPWKALLAQMRQKPLNTSERLHRRKDGTLFPVEVTTNYIVLDREYIVGIARDITARKRTEQALIESHNLVNAIIEGTTDMTFAKDRAGRYLMINSTGARLLGKDVAEIIGHDDRSLFSPEVAAELTERDQIVLATGESQTFEKTSTSGLARTLLTTKAVYRDSNGNINGIVGISRDITELKRLEEQFRQAQKMEAVGRLAGGVAHDFNNLLTVINGYSQLVFNRLPPDDPNRPRLAEIQKAGERAANLTRQLLAFSRKQMLQPRVVNLNTLLAELLKLLQRLIGEDIELALAPADDLGWTKIDPGQFEQAIVNLAVNARDAMPHGGNLTIMTQNTELDAVYAEHYPEVQAGTYVCVTVSDTGLGMAEMTKARIFEPFFTTKEVGKGTGLGLAMVYGFVKQSGGHIDVFSELGSGTTFNLYLPRTEEPGAVLKPAFDLREIPKGTETILLVEDEEAVRNLIRSVLQAGGYTILEAHNGQQAIDLLGRYRGPLHLLITDLVMPRISGRQLADHLIMLRPHARVLFISGYTEEAVTHHKVRELNVAFFQKPFDPISLGYKVRELLDGRAA